jgi:CelD/BcsL family acetyltransferase involved in cellulose biosynthesis
MQTSAATPGTELSSTSLDLSFHILTEGKQVAEMAGDWDRLLQQSNCNLALSSSIWFLAALELQDDVSPYVVIARRRDALAGILPLVFHHRERRLEFPEFANDYCDLIAEPQDSTVISGLLHFTMKEDAQIESVFLDRLRADSNCFEGLEQLVSTGLAKIFVPDRQVYPFVKLSSSYEDYLTTRRGKFRRNLLRARRSAQGKVEIERALPSALSPANLAELFLSLHLARFHDRTPFRFPERQALLHRVLPPLFSANILQVFVMKKEEKIVAIDICFKGKNSLCAWNGGFLPEASDWSPGTLLIDHELRAAYEWGMREFDLMRGSEEYKTSWATDLRAVGSVELTRSDWQAWKAAGAIPVLLPQCRKPPVRL